MFLPGVFLWKEALCLVLNAVKSYDDFRLHFLLMSVIPTPLLISHTSFPKWNHVECTPRWCFIERMLSVSHTWSDIIQDPWGIIPGIRISQPRETYVAQSQITKKWQGNMILSTQVKNSPHQTTGTAETSRAELMLGASASPDSLHMRASLVVLFPGTVRVVNITWQIRG